MPPRARLSATTTTYVCTQCRHATTPAAPLAQITSAVSPISHYPPTVPPSHKPPEFRKSQLHRQYQSLLRSSPLVLLFQHNNLKATEWSGIRRELSQALAKVDAEIAGQQSEPNEADVGEATRLQIVQTGIFKSVLRVLEFWEPQYSSASTPHATDPKTSSSVEIADVQPNDAMDANLTHGLSKQAWQMATQKAKTTKSASDLSPLLSGPLALLTIPSTSPQHLAAALSILSPGKDFPAPKRRINPGYHEKPVQDGIAKLMLLGARVDGRVFDMSGVRWIGGIKGGLTGLRAQLVAMLSGMGAQVTNVLESAGRSVYATVERCKMMLEEEAKPKDGSGEEEKVDG